MRYELTTHLGWAPNTARTTGVGNKALCSDLLKSRNYTAAAALFANRGDDIKL